ARQGVDSTKVTAALQDLFASSPGANFALLFSLPHDFPVEWSKFTQGAADFAATIKRDFFPYFSSGKKLTVVSLEIYGSDLKHHAVGDPEAATTDLADKDKFSFTVSISPDDAGPTQALTRTAKDAFLIITYTL